MKKLIALLLSVLLALTSMAPAYAAKPYLENQNFSIEASIDELADGITFAIIQEADGSLTVQKIEQRYSFTGKPTSGRYFSLWTDLPQKR